MTTKQIDLIPELIAVYGQEIFAAPNMQSERNYIQHGTITCYEHSVSVAYVSLWLAQRLGVRVDQRSLIRGALLHDYFLYDWHKAEDAGKWHGFRHAQKALDNAQKEFQLNPVEQDVIRKHMFPLNVKLPRYRESFLVSCADKICTLCEVATVRSMQQRTQQVEECIQAT